MNKLTTPKRPRALSRKDLREKLDRVPIFSKTKLWNDKGPVQSRINRDLPGPWKTGQVPRCGTEHRNRPFITGGGLAGYEANQPNNRSSSQWQQADGMEEEENERLSEDDISTDKSHGDDSSEEEGA